jgi:eukaryotic-like serine/threonine-protein kinase
VKGLKGFFESHFSAGKGSAAESVGYVRPGPSGPLAPAHEPSIPEATYKKGDLIGGKCEVYRLLGRGGFGEIYLVYARQLGEALAVKTFRQKFLADAGAKEDFKREALLWMNLELHPYIVGARFVDEFSSRLFVGMDYVAADDQGRVSLADHLAQARGPLATDQVLEWAIMFCHGMEHANQRGIKCHRDIKPANILIRQDKVLLISDFGLAAGMEAASRRGGTSLVSASGEGFVGLSLLQTGAKQVCGTPGYIAPEVFRGEGADTTSDIYSFGLVLWQMAAGSRVPPFSAGVAPPIGAGDLDRYALEIYQRQMGKPVPPTSGPLDAVIERCLVPESAKRFASFAELRGELEPMLYRLTSRVVKVQPARERGLHFWQNKGYSLISLERHDEAIACFKKALEIQPDYPPTHLNLGKALQAKGDLNAAIAEWRTTIRLDPNFAMAHANLGSALHRKGNLDEALLALRMAVRLQPDYPNAHNSLGSALVDKGDLDGAIAEFRTAVNIQPDFAEAHANLGSALADRGDLDGAITELRAALRLWPDYAHAHASLGTVLTGKGDFDGAIAEVRVALRLDPNNANAHNYLGAALAKKGDLDKSIAEFCTAIDIQPDFADAHCNLALQLEKKAERDAHGKLSADFTVQNLANVAARCISQVFNDKGGFRYIIERRENDKGGLRSVINGEEQDPNWTVDDALAVWYSIADVAMVLSVNRAFKGDRARMDRFYNLCRPALARQWNIPRPVLEKLKIVIASTEEMGLRFFEETKGGDDLLRFFNWYANRILGVPIPRPMSPFDCASQLGIIPQAGLTDSDVVGKSFMTLLRVLNRFLAEYATCF